jgi:hypothetical protein
MYADFFYSQPPYFALALAGWQSFLLPIFDSAYLLGRLFNIAWSLVLVASLVVLVFRASPRVPLALGTLVTAFASTWLELPLRVVRNDVMPLALVTLSLVAIQAAAERRRQDAVSWSLNLAAGILVSLAVGTKQSYAFVALAFAVYAMFARHLRFSERIWSVVIPLAAGGLIGALPMLIIVGPVLETFAYSNWEFHRTAHALHLYGTVASEVGLRIRLGNFRYMVMEPSFCVFGAMVIFVVARIGIGRCCRAILQARSTSASLLLLCFVALISVFTSCLLSVPMHAQYAAPALPFLALGVCALAATVECGQPLRSRASGYLGLTVATLSGVLLVGGSLATDRGAIAYLYSTINPIKKIGSNHQTRSIDARIGLDDHLNLVRERLRDVLGEPDESIRIATLMSAYPIDAGFGIYPEFAGAPYFYRLNDELTDAELDKFRGTSPGRVRAFLARNEAKVLLTGYESVCEGCLFKDTRLEEGFVAYAVDRGFRCYPVNFDGAGEVRDGRLYVASELAKRPDEC